MDLIPRSPLPAPTPYIPFRFPGLPRVSCAFTTAAAGNLSPVTAASPEEQADVFAAREALRKSLGIKDWAEVHQIHGDLVAVNPDPTPPDAAPALQCDGLATDRPGLALVIKTADCQPILLAHRTGKYIAALHVGWRGNSMDFTESGVQAFCDAYALSPKDVLAVRGPSLGPGAAEFVNFEKEWPARFKPWFNAEARTMDLWSLTRKQLTRIGVLPENIFGLDLCTRSIPNTFFSHRLGHKGRMMNLIMME